MPTNEQAKQKHSDEDVLINEVAAAHDHNDTTHSIVIKSQTETDDVKTEADDVKTEADDVKTEADDVEIK